MDKTQTQPLPQTQRGECLRGAGAAVLSGVEGQRHLQAAQHLVLGPQDPLGPVVPIGQPVGKVGVRQVEVGLGEGVGASFEGAVAGKAVGVQRLGTVLARGEQLVQEGAGVWVVAAAQLLQTGDLHPEARHLPLQRHVHGERRDERDSSGARRAGGEIPRDSNGVWGHLQRPQDRRGVRWSAILPIETRQLQLSQAPWFAAGLTMHLRKKRKTRHRQKKRTALHC